MQAVLNKLLDRQDLTIDEIKQATTYCLEDQISDEKIAALLTALRMKGETADEMAGMAEVIRSQSGLNDFYIPNIMDNCGTGGDGSNSFNISTTTAFVLAGAGVTVAKHGNRSVSSKTGSADVLEELGVSITMTREHTKKMLENNNISFLFAPHIHTKLQPFMKVRKALGIPTIFNLIGPLTNPVNLDSQLLGVYQRDKLEVIAETLHKLGRKRAVVINGAGHMDEASLAGHNHLVLLDNGAITSFTVHPEELGLPACSNDAIRGGTPKENAAILKSVLNNEPSPYLDTVLLNAAIGLFANGKAADLHEGVSLAKESISSGAALARLNTLVSYSENMTSEAI